MKGILGWVKSNLLIVLSTVVIVVSLPLGWFFSSGWNKSIREQQEKDGNQAYNQIRGAKVNYVIPSHDPDEPSWSESLAPNRAVTELVAAERDRRSAAALSVVAEIEAFNQRSHGVLAEGLLPAPVSRTQEIPLKYAFLLKMAGDQRLDAETIYTEVLESIGAGDPPDPIRMAETLNDIQLRESERIMAETGQDSLDDAQAEELRKVLVDRRVAEVQRRAKEISVYASLASFDRGAFGEGATSLIPPLTRQEREEAGNTEPPTLDEVFEWNFDYWIVTDLFDAIDRANTTNGVRANVENAVVKRVDGVAVKALELAPPPDPDDDSNDDYGQPAGPPPPATHTGRETNSAYDVREAQLSVVLDSARLPAFVEALAETNLMTVLDIDISEVDVWEDLRQGFYYGEAPVVRADLKVETIWLRSWTEALMPESVKQGLGIDTFMNEDG